MRIGRNPRAAITLALAALALALTGCAGPADAFAGVRIGSGKMLHAQQVLEHYDAKGQAVPQYLEIWLAPGRGRLEELDASGNMLNVALDTGKAHITFNAATREAKKTDASGIFAVNLSNMMKAYPKTDEKSQGDYAGRPCDLYLLENNGGDWVKLYVDRATGYVLFCDAPLFRLRTAKLEELPLDEAMFTEPHDLVYKGGDGK